MIITIPILLLIFGALSFWILVGSNINWIFKIICIGSFCFFTTQFYYSINSFMGWASLYPPEKMAIHWVIIKEPNPMMGEKGRIYFLAEGEKSQYENQALKMFKYYTAKSEPRLYSVPYTRKLHEALHSQVMGDLKQGKIVHGSLKKGKGKNGKGQGEGKEGKEGGGSESLGEDSLEFHKLTPGEIYKK